MKKLLGLLTALAVTFMIASCSEDTTNPPEDTNGSLYMQSTPAGAEIWVDGTNSTKVTPDTVTSLSEGSHNITLKMPLFRDTTISVPISAGQTTTRAVTLTESAVLRSFGPVRIFETAGTGIDEPSGLDLSADTAYGISSGDKNKVDIYYSTDGTGGEPYLVQSANLGSGMTRVTKFRAAIGATDLDDGVNSPLQNSGTWTNNMDDREPNYVFLYDNDGHYSKVKITNFGGGTGQDPAWVEITWYYNETPGNPNF